MYDSKQFSANQLFIEAGQGFLRRYEEFWCSPEVTPELNAHLVEIEEECGHYTKAELHELLTIFRKSLIKSFYDFSILTTREIDCFHEINEIWQMTSSCLIDDAIEAAKLEFTVISQGATCRRIDIIWKDMFMLILLKEHVKNPRIINVLRKIIQLYTKGEYASCINFCRTAVELSLKEIVPYKMLEKHLGHRCSRYELSDRIYVAKKVGYISAKMAQSANDIRTVANKINHEDITLVDNHYKIIEKTVYVLWNIFTGEDITDPPKCQKDKKDESEFEQWINDMLGGE